MTPVEASDRRSSFCARLKSERERRGTSIATIASTTKVKASLLEALERGDLSRWPKGLYRRSFFRDYVAAVGLPLEPMMSDFVELFTDEEYPCTSPNGGAAREPVHFRLLLDDPAGPPATAITEHDLRTRLTAAVTDLCAAGALAGLVSSVSGVGSAYPALALVMVSCLTTAWLGMSPSLWAVERYRRARLTAANPPRVQTFAPSTLPYNMPVPSAARPSLRERIVDVIGSRSPLREYIERLADSELTFSHQRRRELASVRRQRAEAANRATADEVSVV